MNVDTTNPPVFSDAAYPACPNFRRPVTDTIIIEEHSKIRDALTRNLTHDQEINIVHSSPYLPSRPEELIGLAPKVIVLGLPQSSVSDFKVVTHQVSAWAKAGIGVVVSTPFFDADEAAQLYEAGAHEIVLKTINPTEFTKLIQGLR